MPDWRALPVAGEPIDASARAGRRPYGEWRPRVSPTLWPCRPAGPGVAAAYPKRPGGWCVDRRPFDGRYRRRALRPWLAPLAPGARPSVPARAASRMRDRRDEIGSAAWWERVGQYG